MLGELTSDEKDIVQLVGERFRAADDGLHSQLRSTWDELDGLYNNYSDFKRSYREASENDRDSVLHDGRLHFGYELFIPHTFAVVELTVARTLAHRPRPLVLPRTPDAEPGAEAVQWLLETQLRDIDYELVLQRVGKSGHIYNLGVQKTYWRREERPVRRLTKVNDAWVKPHEPTTEAIHDCPWGEAILPHDFIWDPYADCIERAGWVIHRSFRPTSYVLAKLGLRPELSEDQMPAWPALRGRLTVEDVEGHGNREGYSTLWAGRKRGEAVDISPGQEIPGENLHEVWEYHDGERVIVVLDKEWPVAVAENPCWSGGLPFQIYRPTEVPGRFYGKGAIEPIRDLQHETNQLRSNRQWNALLRLHAAFAYNQDAVDPDDIKLGPGRLTPVQGDPSNVLKELVVGDIPFSSYKEEEALLADFQRTTGLADPAEAVGSVQETATGVQMVQQAAAVRIKMATRRAAVEVARPTVEYFLELNQQRITEPQQIRVPAMPTPEYPNRRWAWMEVGPEQLQAAYDIEIEDLSTSAEDTAQRRQDAQILMALANDPRADGRKLLALAMERIGVARAEWYLAQDNTIPDEALQRIHGYLVQQFGLDPSAVELVMRQGLEEVLGEREGAERGQSPQNGGNSSNGSGAMPPSPVGS